MMPYEVENKFFRICYKPGDGITSFVDKRTGTEMAGTAIPFFTPVYQRTPLHQEVPFSSYEERRALGRNIRGKHAETHIGKLKWKSPAWNMVLCSPSCVCITALPVQ
jgi:hypothetical protein